MFCWLFISFVKHNGHFAWIPVVSCAHITDVHVPTHHPTKNTKEALTVFILHDLWFINSLLLCTPHLQFCQLIILLKFLIQNLVSILGRQTTVDIFASGFASDCCRKWLTKRNSFLPLSYMHISLNMLTCWCMHVFYLELTLHIFFAFVRSLNIWHLCHYEQSVKTNSPRKQLK